MIKSSVLEGLTERRFEVSQAWTESKAEDRVARLVAVRTIKRNIKLCIIGIEMV